MVSKSLVVSACIAVILSIVSAPVVYADHIIIIADQSSRTVQSTPETNVSDSRLTVRTTNDDPTRTYKSWIKFDISELDICRLETATLTFTLVHDRGSGNDVHVSYVNNDCLDNIDWDSKSLTWNNAPGNNTNHIGDLDTDKTTLLGRVSLGDGLEGDAITIDILKVLESDTDGIVQFVLHKSSAYTNFAAHAHDNEAWRPFIEANVHPKHTAIKPYPAMNEKDVYPKPVLHWIPGPYVEELSPKHNIFFSENFNDVSNGIGGVTQDANDYPAPDSPLDFGKTYYWRVDEANSVSGWDPGVIWNFTVETEGYPLAEKYITTTASSNEQDANKTINGSGLNDDDLHDSRTTNMWLSSNSAPGETWIRYDFEKPFKLHQMLIWNYNGSGTTRRQYGFRDVTIEHSLDGVHWIPLDNIPEFTRAPGWSGYASDIIVDFSDVLVQQVRMTALSNWSYTGARQYGLSEVRFLVLPLFPREMNPAEGSTDVDPGVILNWRSGREAETHEVYFGSDPNNLPLAKIVTGIPYAAYDTTELNLQLGQTYYWQVNEVNTLEIPSTWESDILAFSTREFLVVDDFESYFNISPHQVFQTWLDGLGYAADEYFQEYNGNGTGAVVGHDIWSGGYATIIETEIVYSGSKSMPLYYANSGAVNSSQTDRSLSPAQDWTQSGITTLTVHFYGTASNTGQLYVKINNTKIPYPGDGADIAAETWIPWEIDLTSSGASLASVSQLSIGIDGSNASGLLYIDDIQLR